MINKSRETINNIRQQSEPLRHRAANRWALIIIGILLVVAIFILLPLQLYFN